MNENWQRVCTKTESRALRTWAGCECPEKEDKQWIDGDGICRVRCWSMHIQEQGWVRLGLRVLIRLWYDCGRRRSNHGTQGQKILNDFKQKTLVQWKTCLWWKLRTTERSVRYSFPSKKYIEETAEMFGHTQARSTRNPCDPSIKLFSADSPKSDVEKEAMSRTPYWQLRDDYCL